MIQCRREAVTMSFASYRVRIYTLVSARQYALALNSASGRRLYQSRRHDRLQAGFSTVLRFRRRLDYRGISMWFVGRIGPSLTGFSRLVFRAASLAPGPSFCQVGDAPAHTPLPSPSINGVVAMAPALISLSPFAATNRRGLRPARHSDCCRGSLRVGVVGSLPASSSPGDRLE